MTEALQVTEAPLPLQERLVDPRVSLTEMLAQLGIEGLTQEERLGLIEHATLSDFKTVVDLIHRKVAPEDSHEIRTKAGTISNLRTGEVVHHTAAPEMRDSILQRALEYAQQIVAKYRQEGGSLEEALQRCGNLAAFGMVLAHPYEDGNGRTARTIGELIHNGYDGSDSQSVEDLAVVSKNRAAGGGVRIHSYDADISGDWHYLAHKQPFDFLSIVAALDLPLDGQSYTAAARGVFTTPRMVVN